MGSMTRKLRKHATGLSRAGAQRAARNLAGFAEQLPRNAMQLEAVQERFEKMPQAERVQTVAAELSTAEIRRRLGMSAEEQFAAYGFAIRGGVAPEAPADYLDDGAAFELNDYAKTGKHLCESCGKDVEVDGGFISSFIVCHRCWHDPAITGDTIAALPRKNTPAPHESSDQ